jgi:PEP-CTERM motif
VNNLVGTGSDTLTFLGRQDPGFIDLDNVDVEPDADVEFSGSVSSAPEPSTLMLVGGILSAYALFRRRMRC